MHTCSNELLSLVYVMVCLLFGAKSLPEPNYDFLSIEQLQENLIKVQKFSLLKNNKIFGKSIAQWLFN